MTGRAKRLPVPGVAEAPPPQRPDPAQPARSPAPPGPAAQRAVWDAIAASFDRTRARPWPHVVSFLQGLPRGARVLDLMAGNGRHSLVADDAGLDAVWLDWSAALAGLSSTRLPHVPHVVADAVALPFADASFDAAIAVAAVHGIPDADARRRSLRELRRVVRHGAPVQVTVWSRHAPRFRAVPAGQDDVVVPWRADGLDEARSYHLYTPTTLRRDLEAAGWVVERIDQLAVAAEEPDNLVALAHRR